MGRDATNPTSAFLSPATDLHRSPGRHQSHRPVPTALGVVPNHLIGRVHGYRGGSQADGLRFRCDQMGHSCALHTGRVIPLRLRHPSRRGGSLRLLLLTQYYAPEIGAAQTRLQETVAGLQDRGIQVTVVAPVPSYPLGRIPAGFDWWHPARQLLSGVRIIRMPSIPLPGSDIAHRIVGHATFALSSVAAVGLADRVDVALVESPPLLLALPAVALAASGIPYVFHVADPWPDFPIAMGYLQSPVARRAAYALENSLIATPPRSRR